MEKLFALFLTLLILAFAMPAYAFLGPMPFVRSGPQNVVTGGTIDGTVIGGTTPAAIQSTFVTYAITDLSDAACADAVTTCDMIALEASGTLITTYGWDQANDLNTVLPAIVAGLKVKILVVDTVAKDLYIDTEGSTTNIYLDGTPIGDGERVWLDDVTIGESIVCHSASLDGTNYDWFCDSINGVWADKGS